MSDKAISKIDKYNVHNHGGNPLKDVLWFKSGNFGEDDIQMPLKLVKELLKQQESTLKVFLSAYMDSVNTRIDNLMKDVQSVKSSLEFTQAQVEELITSDLRVKEVKVQIEDLGNKLDNLENRSRRNNLCFEESITERHQKCPVF